MFKEYHYIFHNKAIRIVKLNVLYYTNYYFQMTSSDKDFRFMATNDLMVELQKDSIKLDDDSERKVTYLIFFKFENFLVL